MTVGLSILVGIIYSGIAFDQALKLNWNGALVYVCYAVAAVAMIKLLK